MPNRFEIIRTPRGGIDFKRTLKNLGREPKSDHELTSDAYLETLRERDRVKVIGFVNFIRGLGEELSKDGVKIAVIAVGSTTLPKEQRRHQAKDIDLRVLNSKPTNSGERKTAVITLQEAVKQYLIDSQIEFEENNETAYEKIMEDYSGNKRMPARYVDYNNDDPSFVARFTGGLLLHISISGVSSWDLGTHLHEERRHNGSFAVLYKA